MHQKPLKMLTCPKKNGNDGTYDQYYLPDFVALSNTIKRARKAKKNIEAIETYR